MTLDFRLVPQCRGVEREGGLTRYCTLVPGHDGPHRFLPVTEADFDSLFEGQDA